MAERDRARVELKSRIGTLEKQHIEEEEWMRISKVDLRNQLEYRKREYAKHLEFKYQNWRESYSTDK